MIVTSPLLEAIPWIEHGFGTRHAPLSHDGMAYLKQIHSSVAHVANRPEGCAGARRGVGAGWCVAEGDALLTRDPGLTVAIRTADCFPVLLVDTHHQAVAAVHAGWRGTAANIVVETLRRMHAEFDTSPADVVAAIGPGIGACCYEVGEDVARRFGLTEAGRLDLARENLGQLVDHGVPRRQISLAESCTFCDPARFYSWRRDHQTSDRMISFIRVIESSGQAVQKH